MMAAERLQWWWTSAAFSAALALPDQRGSQSRDRGDQRRLKRAAALVLRAQRGSQRRGDGPDVGEDRRQRWSFGTSEDRNTVSGSAWPCVMAAALVLQDQRGSQRHRRPRRSVAGHKRWSSGPARAATR